MSHPTDFTRLLQQAKDGDEDARALAFELVYDELRQVARRVERGSVDADTCALDDSLGELAHSNPRHARVVELRGFGGLTIDETAEALGVSHGTAESAWSMARAWSWKRLAPVG